jgi:hypothetical protein
MKKGEKTSLLREEGVEGVGGLELRLAART